MNNQHLQRLSDKRVKDAWLTLIDACKKYDAGLYDGCSAVLQEIRPYFQQYQVFARMYQQILAYEHQKSLAELNRLLEQMKNSNCTAADAARMYESARQLIPRLDPSHRSEFRATFENRLLELKPQTPEELLLEEYSNALMVGNALAADQLKSKYQHISFDEVADRIATQYSIRSDLLNVIVDNDMPIDLITDAGGFEVIGRCGNEVLLKYGDDSIMAINPLSQIAFRYTHEYFIDSVFCDILPDDGLYLFRNKSNLAFKARLAGADARIICSFEIPDDFVGADCLNLYMSSEKSNEVYFWTCSYSDKEEVIGRFIRFDYFKQRSNHSTSMNAETFMSCSRLGYDPDRFVLEVDLEYVAYNKRLEKSSKAVRGIMIGYDAQTKHSYLFDGDVLYEHDKDSKLVSEMPLTADDANDWIPFDEVVGINTGRKIVLMSRNNSMGWVRIDSKYSKSFSIKNIICTGTPSELFYYSFHGETRSFTLSYISSRIEHFIKWDDNTYDEE